VRNSCGRVGRVTIPRLVLPGWPPPGASGVRLRDFTPIFGCEGMGACRSTWTGPSAGRRRRWHFWCRPVPGCRAASSSGSSHGRSVLHATQAARSGIDAPTWQRSAGTGPTFVSRGASSASVPWSPRRVLRSACERPTLPPDARFGEAYQAGDWSSPQPADLLTAFATQLTTVVPPSLQGLRIWAQRIRGHLESNTAAVARPNTHAH
jgi:hypothetical protein